MPEFCVTGFIAAYLVKALLEKGYNVRATVRDPATERLKVDGSFDDAIQGVDGVFHAAFPVLVPQDDHIQETLIDPIIKGTVNVLSSCSKSSTVKRLWYAYAKTLGERGLATGRRVCGGSPDCTTTNQHIPYDTRGKVGEYPNTALGFVHIDDVVSAHMLAMEEHKASGRLICSSTIAHWSEVIKMLKAKYPSYPIVTKCAEKKEDDKLHSMDTSKIEQLGLHTFKTLPQMFDDCIKSFQVKELL